jgi:hypothetical protein
MGFERWFLRMGYWGSSLGFHEGWGMIHDVMTWVAGSWLEQALVLVLVDL